MILPKYEPKSTSAPECPALRVVRRAVIVWRTDATRMNVRARTAIDDERESLSRLDREMAVIIAPATTGRVSPVRAVAETIEATGDLRVLGASRRSILER